MKSIELDQLDAAIGGASAPVCTPSNPTGARPTQSLRSWNGKKGMSLSQQIIHNTDRAMAPWKLFNGIFGGARGGRITMPPRR